MTFFRKIIRIRAEDSPNVRLAHAQSERGDEPTGDDVLPGVLSWSEYKKRRRLWDPVRQTIGLDAEFPEGRDTLLYPPQWLDRAEQLDRIINSLGVVRKARSLGIDTAEGGDDTVWTVIDELGIMEVVSKKTQDTAVITGETIAMMKRYQLEPSLVLFDRGGGGQQHADRLRQQGFNVRTVAFGEVATDPEQYKRFHWFQKSNATRLEDVEIRYVYKNRRAEMYGLLRELLDPTLLAEEDRELGPGLSDTIGAKVRRKESVGFAIPARLTELRRQLAPLPLRYDPEGRMYLPPKNKRSKDSKEETIQEMIGCSPDEADSLVLAVYGMLSKPKKRVLGAY